MHLKLPKFLISYFRTNHAGETGAVYIYKGILKISKDKDIINFSKKHLTTEKSHLQKIEKIFPIQNVSRLIFLWKILGFLTGFIPALLGKKFVYATIFSVESFVERHYQEQINIIENKKNYSEIKEFIQELMDDEIDHKEEALEKINELKFTHRLWASLVTLGSVSAVKISKII